MCTTSLTKTYEKRCVNCGQLFEASQPQTRICFSCKNPLNKVCPVCKTEFQAKRIDTVYCSTKCRNRAPIPSRQDPGPVPPKSCAICQTDFTPNHSSEKYCSQECRREASRRANAVYQEKLKTRSGSIRRSSTNDRRKETVNAEDMPVLNRVNNRNDRDKLRRAKVKSPDHTKMPFKHYDEKLRIMRYFRTEEKYHNFLETKQKQNA
ncbi:hypothetical protein [uncultured Sunxiuqinia sp.]|uniref:hypothetical protein n=1 Tax=uncultured Sunxiuqinia sp. TaxID=1573825 RepID=UPI002615979F|nr:hypothetical protein [uncultured Sunxiuqinia sp.]